MGGHHILVFDLDKERRHALTDRLASLGKVECVTSREQAKEFLRTRTVSVFLANVSLLDPGSLELLDVARQVRTLTVLITGAGSLDVAISAVRCGAFDYISSPFLWEDLVEMVSRAVNRWKALASSGNEETAILPPLSLAPKPLVGKSRVMMEVFRSVAKATASSGTVLITGETGTGKELVARAIHENSRRSKGRFLAVNCAALTDTLLESELFGYVKGAFTGATHSRRGIFEEASGGTLFLDEIGDISPALQVKLLRVLQDQEIRPVGSTESRSVDVRVVAATHRDLPYRVREGKFREDLLYRLRVITIQMPPLRDRREDIEELVRYFLFRLCRKDGRPVAYVTDEAMTLLRAYHWPGNVRELEHAVEHALSMSSTPVLFPEDFPREIARDAEVSADEILAATEEFPLRTLDEWECIYIVKVLERMRYNISRTAEILGIDRGTLYRKAEKYGIPLKPQETREKVS